MGKYQDELRLDIQESQKAQRDVTRRALEEFERTGGFSRPPALRDVLPGIKENPTGFLPQGQRSSIEMMNYQGMPGQMYANAPDVAPGTKFGTDLYPPPPPYQPPVVVTPPPDDSGGSVPPDDVGGMDPDFDQLEIINASRKEQGLPPFKSIEDFYDFISDITEGGPGGPYASQVPLFNEGGLMSLPQGFAGGGGAGGVGKSEEKRQQEEVEEQIGRNLFGGIGNLFRNIGIGRAGRMQRRADRRAMRQQRRGDRQMLRMANRSHQPMAMPSSGQPQPPSSSPAQQEPIGRKQRRANRRQKIKNIFNVFPDAKQEMLDQIIPNESNSELIRQAKRYAPYFGSPYQSGVRDLRSFIRRQRFGAGPSGQPGTIKSAGPTIDFGRYADGGIAQLPVEMNLGGVMQGMGKGLGALSEGMNSGSSSGFDNVNEEDIENMTREELIEYIKSGKAKKTGSGFGADLRTIGSGIKDIFGGSAGAPTAAADGGLMYLAQGDMVENFPRVNGPISGPGTETSDDIPAMLSDGEFVVNAKAVRGIGKLKGADKSRAEQRREGAKMMYALQRAGEQAIRRA